jgi:hypothetical protein
MAANERMTQFIDGILRLCAPTLQTLEAPLTLIERLPPVIPNLTELTFSFDQSPWVEFAPTSAAVANQQPPKTLSATALLNYTSTLRVLGLPAQTDVPSVKPFYLIHAPPIEAFKVLEEVYAPFVWLRAAATVEPATASLIDVCSAVHAAAPPTLKRIYGMEFTSNRFDATIRGIQQQRHELSAATFRFALIGCRSSKSESLLSHLIEYNPTDTCEVVLPLIGDESESFQQIARLVSCNVPAFDPALRMIEKHLLANATLLSDPDNIAMVYLATQARRYVGSADVERQRRRHLWLDALCACGKRPSRKVYHDLLELLLSECTIEFSVAKDIGTRHPKISFFRFQKNQKIFL